MPDLNIPVLRRLLAAEVPDLLPLKVDRAVRCEDQTADTGFFVCDRNGLAWASVRNEDRPTCELVAAAVNNLGALLDRLSELEQVTQYATERALAAEAEDRLASCRIPRHARIRGAPCLSCPARIWITSRGRRISRTRGRWQRWRRS
ncbi:hypothetical protein [Nocardia sp. CC227C]|uniref:hypothetical protein n=1 Tax=Nocardia sp. CC227C TaxID=3044562 RepID=UPI00278C0668|nr:hypothetical protein [Nocardia sp. CC227C]